MLARSVFLDHEDGALKETTTIARLIQEGRWKELENTTLWDINGSPVQVGDDKWETPKGHSNFVFTGEQGKILPLRLSREIKAVAVANLFLNPNTFALSTINSNLYGLKRLAVHGLMPLGVDTLDNLNEEVLQEAFVMMEMSGARPASSLPALNNLLSNRRYLPFNLFHERIRLSEDDFNLSSDPVNQTPVIPFRIYLSLVDTLSNEISDIYEDCARLEDAVALSISIGKDRDKKKVFRKIRIGSRYVASVSELRSLITELNCKSIFLCLALTGMRRHELAMCNANFAIQFVTAGRSQREIPVLTTLTSKITETSQVKNSVFVTTPVGHKAFEILKAIHLPHHKYFDEPSNTMWASINKSFEDIAPIENPASYITNTIKKTLPSYLSTDMTIKAGDLELLALSDPSNTKYKTGDTWELLPHQLRRSLAFYLVGFELAGFLQLRHQFGHFAIGMSLYYGKNAEKFTDFYKELTEERLEQQSEKMAGIYSRIANGERIAGGAGKRLRREMKNHALDRGNLERKCSKSFWKNELSKRNNEMRVHAVAPGIICTNSACDMRIDIDLSECIDCDFDYIENASYAEQTRQISMNRLAYMERENEMYPDKIASEMVRIRSAEKILDDLGVPYHRFSPGSLLGETILASTIEID